MHEIALKIQQEAARLLEQDVVDMVIGYQEARRGRGTKPCVVTDPADVGQLTFGEDCHHNLARYLVGPDGYLGPRQNGHKPRLAIVARPATMQTLAGLIKENQLQRADLVVLGISNGVVPEIAADVELGHIEEPHPEEEGILAGIESLGRMSPINRWLWWQQVFARCIRCYACRQVCPFCYCEQCVVDENEPQWIDRSALPENNRSWNVIRAFHLVGRCTGCGECERVCPAEIPLTLINKKLALELADVAAELPGLEGVYRVPIPFRQTKPPQSGER